MNISDYTDEQLLAARETAAEPGIEEFTQEVIRLRGELREVLSLANMDCDGLNCPPSRALEAQVSALRSLVASWLGECECSPDDMPPNIHNESRNAIADTAAAAEAHDTELLDQGYSEAAGCALRTIEGGIQYEPVASALRARDVEVRAKALEFAAATVRRFLSFESQRAVSWHEVNDCLGALAKGETGEAVARSELAEGERALLVKERGMVACLHNALEGLTEHVRKRWADEKSPPPLSHQWQLANKVLADGASMAKAHDERIDGTDLNSRQRRRVADRLRALSKGETK